MHAMQNTGYNHIRPFTGDEIPAAAGRLAASREFLSLFSRMLGWSEELLAGMLREVATPEEFQRRFFLPVIKELIRATTGGVTLSGMEHLEKDKAYLFVSNHRDIILDSAILNTLLIENGYPYCQAAIGSNLLINDWVTDMVRLNSCFIIERNLPVKEMVTSAGIRSRYIRELIEENDYSVWIAQREGRAKNGDDRTQHALLKMFKMSGPKDFAENFRTLHLVPLAISYEWEPCDDMKTSELYRRDTGEYVKTPEDDMTSMYRGLAEQKGRVHFAIGQPIDKELDAISRYPNNGDRVAALAACIDAAIHRGYKPWPNNYIAHDLVHGSTRFAAAYTDDEKKRFVEAMTRKTEALDGNRSALNRIYLDIYANPVKNHLEIITRHEH
ncbi:MAG: 1-acyl-sn-glycerol-3-phosphate acyltransferase [Odoribacteraceae bacterium]|jgi:1-acyl-sn-glycerol-3-phosphate acyltransferase|nr:1-acyl-sn-glycerol-3-phosphate acyltransferase [Odoribacteraceae bacterium]